MASPCFPVVQPLMVGEGAIAGRVLGPGRRFRLPANADGVQELADQSECINDVVVLSGGEREKFATQVREPSCPTRNVEPVKRHSSPYRLSPNCLVSSDWKVSAIDPGRSLTLHPL